MRDYLIFTIGWFCGGAVMWAYFKGARLIRNREEWQRAKLKVDE